jgi:hypothetical protein
MRPRARQHQDFYECRSRRNVLAKPGPGQAHAAEIGTERDLFAGSMVHTGAPFLQGRGRAGSSDQPLTGSDTGHFTVFA